MAQPESTPPPEIPAEPPVNEAEADEKTPLPEEPVKKPGFFSPERSARRKESAGRALRMFLRGLAFFLIALGIGALLVFFLLYRPMVDQWEQSRQEVASTSQQLQTTRQDLEKANSELKTVRAESEEMQSRLSIELARINVLRSMNEITKARLALANKDNQAAGKALDASQAYLKEILPTLEKLDSSQASTLQALYTLAKNDLQRDPKLAAQDFDRLQSELERAEKNVLKSTE